MILRLNLGWYEASDRLYERDKLELAKAAYPGMLGEKSEGLSTLFEGELVAEA